MSMRTGEQASTKKARGVERGLAFVAIAAAAWMAVDALVLGQGAIALVVCAVAILYLLPRAAWAWKDRGLMKLRLTKAAITLAAGLAALAFIRYDNVRAREKAAEVIAAVDHFKQERGRYPDRLEEAIAPVPSARHAFIARDFSYWGSPSDPTLSYVTMPPYGRRTYSFERRGWRFLD